MGFYDDTVEVCRRTMVLFFVIDVSGSMKGERIGAVNEAIRNVESMLADISEENADARIKVATLTFSTAAEWITPVPVEAERFRWEDLEAQGITNLGEAFIKLNEKLSRNGFMSDIAGSYAPAIFLMSDGAPTDDWEHGLNKLKQNNWYRKAIKVAVAIGDKAEHSVLKAFTGTEEAVITVHSAEELKKWIKFVSVRASEVGSQSSQAGALATDASNGNACDSKQELFLRTLQDEQVAQKSQATQQASAPQQAPTAQQTQVSQSTAPATQLQSPVVTAPDTSSWDVFGAGDAW